MADINATNLTPETLSTLDGTENIVAFDTAEGKKIPLSVLGDYVVQKLTQTLMGQTLTPQAAINFLKSRADVLSNELFTIIPADDDLNNYVTPGVYSANNNATASSLSNCPASSSFKLIVGFIYGTSETGNSRYLQQRIIMNGGSADTEFIRRVYTTNGGTSWTYSEWLKTPTRSEFDSISAKLSGIVGISNTGLNITKQSTGTFNVPSNSNHLLILTGASSTVFGILLVSAKSSNGEIVFESVTAGSDLTIVSPSENTLTIVNAYTNTCYVYDICLRGSVITAVTS